MEVRDVWKKVTIVLRIVSAFIIIKPYLFSSDTQQLMQLYGENNGLPEIEIPNFIIKKPPKNLTNSYRELN